MELNMNKVKVDLTEKDMYIFLFLFCPNVSKHLPEYIIFMVYPSWLQLLWYDVAKIVYHMVIEALKLDNKQNIPLEMCHLFIIHSSCIMPENTDYSIL